MARAAVESFSTRGFHGTTTRDIAAAAGLSPAAMYVHHRTKEDLLFGLCLAGHQDVLDLVKRAAAGSDEPAEQLCALVRAFTANHARNHVLARVINYELGSLSADHLATIRELRHGIDIEVRAIIEAGVASGAFQTNSPEMAATAILSLGVDVARWYQDGKAWSPDELGDFYADLALRMLNAT